jgi:hypothetical protein
LFKDH